MQKGTSGREKLIIAGISLAQQVGVGGLSLRKVASACGMSCAAPYKHFKDKQAFVLAMLEYIKGEWNMRQQALLAACDSDARTRLLAISMGYINFLLDHPHFRTIIMMRQQDLTCEQRRAKGELSQLTQELIRVYCEKVGMADDVRERKTLVVRSLIYGAALLVDSGELARDARTMSLFSDAISREFELN